MAAGTRGGGIEVDGRVRMRPSVYPLAKALSGGRSSREGFVGAGGFAVGERRVVMSFFYRFLFFIVVVDNIFFVLGQVAIASIYTFDTCKITWTNRHSVILYAVSTT